MVRKYSILIIVLSLFFIKKSVSIESAAHEAELAKCLGVFMTIKNNDFNQKYKNVADNVLTVYKEKIRRLKSSQMTKEMSAKGAKIIESYNIQKMNNDINNLLNSCIMTFRVGN